MHENLAIHFRQGSVGTNIRCGRQYILILLEIYSNVTVPKNIEIG